MAPAKLILIGPRVAAVAVEGLGPGGLQKGPELLLTVVPGTAQARASRESSAGGSRTVGIARASDGQGQMCNGGAAKTEPTFCGQNDRGLKPGRRGRRRGVRLRAGAGASPAIS